MALGGAPLLIAAVLLALLPGGAADVAPRHVPWSSNDMVMYQVEGAIAGSWAGLMAMSVWVVSSLRDKDKKRKGRPDDDAPKDELGQRGKAYSGDPRSGLQEFIERLADAVDSRTVLFRAHDVDVAEEDEDYASRWRRLHYTENPAGVRKLLDHADIDQHDRADATARRKVMEIEEMDRCASRVQAIYRGHLVRTGRTVRGGKVQPKKALRRKMMAGSTMGFKAFVKGVGGGGKKKEKRRRVIKAPKELAECRPKKTKARSARQLLREQERQVIQRRLQLEQMTEARGPAMQHAAPKKIQRHHGTGNPAGVHKLLEYTDIGQHNHYGRRYRYSLDDDQPDDKPTPTDIYRAVQPVELCEQLAVMWNKRLVESTSPDFLAELQRLDGSLTQALSGTAGTDTAPSAVVRAATMETAISVGEELAAIAQAKIAEQCERSKRKHYESRRRMRRRHWQRNDYCSPSREIAERCERMLAQGLLTKEEVQRAMKQEAGRKQAEDEAKVAALKWEEDKVAATDMAALVIQRTVFRFAQLAQLHYAPAEQGLRHTRADVPPMEIVRRVRLHPTRREDWERAIAAQTKLGADKAAAAEAAEALKAEQQELRRSLEAKQRAHEDRACAVGLVSGNDFDWRDGGRVAKTVTVAEVTAAIAALGVGLPADADPRAIQQGMREAAAKAERLKLTTALELPEGASNAAIARARVARRFPLLPDCIAKEDYFYGSNPCRCDGAPGSTVHSPHCPSAATLRARAHAAGLRGEKTPPALLALSPAFRLKSRQYIYTGENLYTGEEIAAAVLALGLPEDAADATVRDTVEKLDTRTEEEKVFDDKVANLKTGNNHLYPAASEDDIKTALLEAEGHAGRASKVLMKQAMDRRAKDEAEGHAGKAASIPDLMAANLPAKPPARRRRRMAPRKNAQPGPEPQAYQEDKSVRWNMERGLVVPEPPRLAEQR